MPTCGCCYSFTPLYGCIQCRFTTCDKCLEEVDIQKDTQGILICSNLCRYIYMEKYGFQHDNLLHAQFIKTQTKIYTYWQHKIFKKSILLIIKQIFINDIANIIIRLI